MAASHLKKPQVCFRSDAPLPTAARHSVATLVQLPHFHSVRPSRRCHSPACTGLPTYTRPQLPVDLNSGYPDNFTPKTQGERSPVDTIVQAANGAGVEWRHFDVCTYRNNLNKILLMTINNRCVCAGAHKEHLCMLVQANQSTQNVHHQPAVCPVGGAKPHVVPNNANIRQTGWLRLCVQACKCLCRARADT